MPRNPSLGDFPESVRKQIRSQLEADDAAAIARAPAKCWTCGGKGTIPTEDGGAECPACVDRAAMLAKLRRGEGVRPPGGFVGAAAPRKRPWSAAKKTVVDGRTFDSQMESRVYTRLKAELRPEEMLMSHVRMPILGEPPGKVLFLTVDFAILRENSAPGFICVQSAYLPIRCGELTGWWVRWIEAKNPKRVSRDWVRGKAAFETCWGKIEEVNR